MKTLAETQLERDMLKAQQAKNAYTQALSQTVPAMVLVQAKEQVSDNVGVLFKTVARDLVNGVDGVVEENRLHYLMSDGCNGLLNELAAKSKGGVSDSLLGAFGSAVKPKGLKTVSQWAEEYRMMASGTNLPGHWRNENAPHAVEIMDSLSMHSPCRTVTFMKASGVSGTEIELNWVGYVMAHAKMDLLHVVPTLELRDRTFNPKFKKLFKETPVLAELFSELSRDETNRKDMMDIDGVRIIKSGANSPDSLRAEHIAYVIADEIDAFPWDVGGEGDPITLIENRQKTFTRAKSFYLSTPTHADLSIIEKLFMQGDQRYRYVPCPHCDHMQMLKFSQFKYRISPAVTDRKIVAAAWFECAECGGEIKESQKNAMLDRGRWRASQPHIKHHRSYHLNAFYVKYGLGESWRLIAQKWVDAQGDTDKLKAFTNTYLAETWQGDGEGIESVQLLSKLEEFGDVEGAVRAAGVDVQADRLELTIVDFEASEEAWTQHHLILEGDTLFPDVWDELDEMLHHHRVEVAAVDSGYRADQVYQFCEGKRWVIPIKGNAGMARAFIEDKTKRTQRLRRRRKKGQSPEPIGVDQGKALLYARLKLSGESGERSGMIHFRNCSDFDDEYFAQLTAEKLVTKKRGGREFYEWQKTRSRNEALDCWIYALAAKRLREHAGIRLTALSKQSNRPTTQPTRRYR